MGVQTLSDSSDNSIITATERREKRMRENAEVKTKRKTGREG